MDDMQAWLEAHFPGWEMGQFGDTFICPHGNEVEVDGTSFDGCVSPVIQKGLM